MSDGPQKPDSIPQSAVWDAEQRKWEIAQHDAEGQRDGERLLYREDGSLYSREHFRAGVPDGPFWVYHPNGAIAREGAYTRGVLDGAVVARRSDGPTFEQLRDCCVPENAWELRFSYRSGALQNETFYDRQGRALLDDGSFYPDRPAGVEPAAYFDQSLRRWRLDTPSEESRAMHARHWSLEGGLLEDVEYRPDGRTLSRVYDGEGRARREFQCVETNVLDGPYRERFGDPRESPYEDRRIREVRGIFQRGQAVGHWAFLDEAGTTLTAVERGPAFDGDTSSPIFAEAAMDAANAARWCDSAQRLLGENRLREALVAAARAAACARDATPLLQCLDDRVIPLLSSERERRGEQLVASPGATLTAALDALIAGVDAAAALRTAAAVTTGASAAARDFIEASLLVAPARTMSRLTRALIRIELGDDVGALDDAAAVAGEAPNAAEFVRSYVRVAFPAYSFRPASESLDAGAATMPVTPEQPLERVQHVIQVYATRLADVRRALRLRVPSPERPWMPPERLDLLPSGLIALRSFDATITDESDEGTESIEVRIDERVNLEQSVPALLRVARYDWCALTWLCWSLGLAEIRWPTAIAPRPEFPSAASMFVARFWRAQDRLTTGGIIARTQGVPGFAWEGMDIDEMPAQLAEIAAGEYLEARSMFLWLMSRDNLSPFQSDLRSD